MELVKWHNRTKPTFSNLLNEFFSNDPFTPVGGRMMTTTVPAVNIRESDTAFLIEVAAPGLSKEAFQIQVGQDNKLLISSEGISTSEEHHKSTYRHKEFAFGPFKKNFSLPDSVDSNQISASYDNGLLVVSLPKKAEAKIPPPRTISID